MSAYAETPGFRRGLITHLANLTHKMSTFSVYKPLASGAIVPAGELDRLFFGRLSGLTLFLDENLLAGEFDPSGLVHQDHLDA